MDTYFDKETGVVVDMIWEGDYTTRFSIVESNRWVAPEFPAFLIIPLFMVATLLAVIVYRRKKGT